MDGVILLSVQGERGNLQDNTSLENERGLRRPQDLVEYILIDDRNQGGETRARWMIDCNLQSVLNYVIEKKSNAVQRIN